VSRHPGRMSLEEKIGQLTQLGRNIHPGATAEDIIRQAGPARFCGSTTRSSSTHSKRSPSRESVQIRSSSPRRDSTATARSSPYGWPWPPRGIRRLRTGADRGRQGGPAPQVCTGPSARCSTSPVTPLGPHRRGRRRRPLSLGAAMGPPGHGFQGVLSARRRVVLCQTFLPVMARQTAGPTTILSTCRGQFCATSTSALRGRSEAGVGTFMSAYMDPQRCPRQRNRFLLRDVLRGEWGSRLCRQ